MTFKRRVLIACIAAAMSLGAAAAPAMAENATAHQMSKTMRHQPIMMHRGKMMMHHKRMMHRPMMHKAL